MLAFLLAASLYAFGGLGNLVGTKPGADSAQCRAASTVNREIEAFGARRGCCLQVLEKPAPATPVAFKNAKGGSGFAGRLQGQGRFAQPVGDMVRTLPSRNAGSGQASGGTRRPDFEVVAVNIDTRNFDKPKQFLDEIKVQKLGYFSDPSAKIFQDLKAAGRAFGMPTTILVDAQGCELAWLAGPAEWASADARAFIRGALGKGG